MAQTEKNAAKDSEMRIDRSIPRYIIRHGALTALFLIGYFLFATVLDFEEIIELRYLNVFILFIGVFTANYFYHRKAHERITNYLNGFALGMGTASVAGLIFSIFMYVFMVAVAPEFGLTIKEVIPFRFVSIELVALVTFLETALSGFLATFAAMQYFKNVDEIEPS